MPYEVGYSYSNPLEYPMTEVYDVEHYSGYEWSLGKVFVHDESGLYTWIQESGCSCNGFLDHIDDLEEFRPIWAPLHYWKDDVLHYIEQGDRDNGPDWVVSEKAKFIQWMMVTRG